MSVSSVKLKLLVLITILCHLERPLLLAESFNEVVCLLSYEFVWDFFGASSELSTSFK